MPKSASDSPSLAPSRKFDRDMQIPPETQVVIDFDDNRAASALVGPYGQKSRADRTAARRRRRFPRQPHHHRRLARRLRRGAAGAGDALCTGGPGPGSRAGRRRRRDPRRDRAGLAVRIRRQGGQAAFETINLRKRPVRARTAAQDSYIRALKRHELVFGVGPAGTGKTWLAVAHAAQLFERKEVDASSCRVPRSRPASGSASCPATCARRSILICGRSTTRCTT